MTMALSASVHSEAGEDYPSAMPRPYYGEKCHELLDQCGQNRITGLTRQMYQTHCQDHWQKNHCEESKKSQPGAENTFLSCENNEDLCALLSEREQDKDLINCGKGVGGFLLDSLLGVVFIPYSVWQIATGRGQLSQGFRECFEDLGFKKLVLGDLKPAEMTDKSLAAMSCADAQKLARAKSEAILRSLEARRQKEMAESGLESLSYWDMDLTNAERSALFQNQNKAQLPGFACLKRAEAAKKFCHMLAATGAGVAAGASGAGLSSRAFARLKQRASQARPSARLAAPETVGGEEVQRIIPGNSGDPLSRAVKKVEKVGGEAYVKPSKPGETSIASVNMNENQQRLIMRPEIANEPYQNSGTIAHEMAHISSNNRSSRQQNLGYARTIEFKAVSETNFPPQFSTYQDFFRIDEVYARSVQSGADLSSARKALNNLSYKQASQFLQKVEAASRRGISMEKRSADLLRQVASPGASFAYDKARGVVEVRLFKAPAQAPHPLAPPPPPPLLSHATTNIRITVGKDLSESAARDKVNEIIRLAEKDNQRFMRLFERNLRESQTLRMRYGDLLD